jgi:hypothetical protein
MEKANFHNGVMLKFSVNQKSENESHSSILIALFPFLVNSLTREALFSPCLIEKPRLKLTVSVRAGMLLSTFL